MHAKDMHSLYKYAVIASKGNGYIYIPQKRHSKTLWEDITYTLASCRQRLHGLNLRTTCKVAFLGNTAMAYNTKDELKVEVEKYITRLKETLRLDDSSNRYKTWEDTYVLDYACIDIGDIWNSSFPDAINEAKQRGLNCKS